jgi:L-ascorbate metabolism protein UlaG (beta-lactamase superfamily)
MFEIEYKGANAVVINTKKVKIVIDPKLSLVGLKDLSAKESVEVATEARFACYDKDATITIDGPGEYGIADFDIIGFAAQRHIDDEKQIFGSTVYRMEIGDARIGVIGNIDSKLSDDQLECLGVIDILIIPVGGNGYTLDFVDAAKLVHIIEPKIVIPVHYQDETIKYEVIQDGLDKFITELGAPMEEAKSFKYKPPFTYPTGLTVIKITRS